MSERLERTLAAMDVGLQSSDERGYPSVADDGSMCARCLAEPRGDGDIGPKCRAYLLGDSDEDPSGWHPLIVEDDGTIHGYIGPDPRWVAHYGDESNILRGYAVHHRDGNPRNNDMANLEIVPVDENAMRPAAYRVSSGIDVPEWHVVTCDACGAVYACDPQRTAAARDIMRNDGHGRENSCTLGLNDAAVEAMREDALRRIAVGLDLPPEIVETSRSRHPYRDWQAEGWSHSEAIGWEFEAMARRYEEHSR